MMKSSGWMCGSGWKMPGSEGGRLEGYLEVGRSPCVEVRGGCGSNSWQGTNRSDGDTYSYVFYLWYFYCNFGPLGPIRPTGGGPKLDGRARIQFGGVNFGVFSTSRIVPLALSSEWVTFFFCYFVHNFWLSDVIAFCDRQTDIFHHRQRVIFRHWWGVLTDLGIDHLSWKTDRHFLSLAGGPNWPFQCLDCSPLLINLVCLPNNVILLA